MDDQEARDLLDFVNSNLRLHSLALVARVDR